MKQTTGGRGDLPYVRLRRITPASDIEGEQALSHGTRGGVGAARYSDLVYDQRAREPVATMGFKACVVVTTGNKKGPNTVSVTTSDPTLPPSQP